MREPSLERLRQNLLPVDNATHAEDALRAEYPTARLGAVLALFYPRPCALHLALTLRTPHLRTHSGQISLPGGGIDPLDFSPLEAALRETREEVGIATDSLDVLGSLEPVFTQASNYVLLPFVAWSDRAPVFVPNPDEVAESIELPVSRLLDPATHQDELWELRGARRRVGFYRHGKHKIWGATAKVLRQIVERSGGPPPENGLVPPGDVRPEVAPAERGP